MKTHGMLALAAWFALATPGTAAILTVGPGGTHATVQAAIDDAQATPDDDELRLRATTFFEHLELFESDTGGRLEISGGWDAAFAVRDLEHESTGARISAGKSGSVLMSLPKMADVFVICVPASCIPSPESPQKRTVMSSRSMTRLDPSAASLGWVATTMI